MLFTLCKKKPKEKKALLQHLFYYTTNMQITETHHPQSNIDLAHYEFPPVFLEIHWNFLYLFGNRRKEFQETLQGWIVNVKVPTLSDER